MSGAGLFGLGIGPQVPLATLMLHVFFGAVLGWLYARLRTPAGLTAAVA